MANYIEITNDAGRTIINDSWHNYSLSDVQTVYSNNGFAQLSCAATDLVFVQIQDSGAEFNTIRYSNLIEVLTMKNNRVAGGVLVKFYRFKQRTSGQSASLQVLDRNGGEIFNSNLRYLNVIDNRVYPSGRTYDKDIAVYCPFNYEVDSSGHVWYRNRYIMPSTKSIRVTDTYKEQYLDSLRTFGQAPELIVDVTNL